MSLPYSSVHHDPPLRRSTRQAASTSLRHSTEPKPDIAEPERRKKRSFSGREDVKVEFPLDNKLEAGASGAYLQGSAKASRDIMAQVSRGPSQELVIESEPVGVEAGSSDASYDIAAGNVLSPDITRGQRPGLLDHIFHASDGTTEMTLESTGDAKPLHPLPVSELQGDSNLPQIELEQVCLQPIFSAQQHPYYRLSSSEQHGSSGQIKHDSEDPVLAALLLEKHRGIKRETRGQNAFSPLVSSGSSSAQDLHPCEGSPTKATSHPQKAPVSIPDSVKKQPKTGRKRKQKETTQAGSEERRLAR